jgi:hypothetical protein
LHRIAVPAQAVLRRVPHDCLLRGGGGSCSVGSASAQEIRNLLNGPCASIDEMCTGSCCARLDTCHAPCHAPAELALQESDLRKLPLALALMRKGRFRIAATLALQCTAHVHGSITCLPASHAHPTRPP